MDTQRMDLGELSDIAAVQALVDVRGMQILDIGCGAGALARGLAAAGANVLGVEPDPIQAEKNRAVETPANLRFTEGRAEDMPAESQSIDGVFFCRSLHHIPFEQMDAALIEAARVLKPEGFLCVLEPSATSGYSVLQRPFHDESVVRANAQAALQRAVVPRFERLDLYVYQQRRGFADFASFVTQVSGSSFNSIRREDVETDEVRTIFEGGRGADGYWFGQSMLVNFYRGPRQ